MAAAVGRSFSHMHTPLLYKLVCVVAMVRAFAEVADCLTESHSRAGSRLAWGWGSHSVFTLCCTWDIQQPLLLRTPLHNISKDRKIIYELEQTENWEKIEENSLVYWRWGEEWNCSTSNLLQESFGSMGVLKIKILLNKTVIFVCS